MSLILSKTSRRIAATAAAFLFVLLSVLSASAQTPTNIQVTSTVVQSSVKRLGVNLADQTFYDSGQMLKNLIFQNPGFEPEKYRSIMICNAVSANTCTDDNNYSPQPTGFWTGGTYKIISGNSAGKTGTIVSSTKNPSSCSGCGQIIQFDQNINAAVGDYFVLSNNFPGNGDAGWWDSTSGGGTITSETNDLSSETPGTQAIVLGASASGASSSVTQYWDSDQGLSFIQMNGNFAVTFRAKGVGGANQLAVGVARLGGPANLYYLQQTVALTNTWQDYTLTFSANETGSASGTAQLVFTASGSSVELDDVSLAQTNSNASNPTAFRDDVVTALQQLQPGTIRMMAGDAALGSDLINQIQVPFARYRMGWSTGGTSTNVVAYGIHEFLQLCQQVGADPWITIPTATTTTEMQAFIQYLTGTGSDQYSALRISRGQSAPWTSVFNKIHLELGNETWNGSFRGESMNYYAYPGLANQVFGAARATTGYQASKFDLVLDGFISAGYDTVLLATSNQHDSIDMAPYLLFSANNEAMSTMFGALFAEPEMWSIPGGGVANVVTAVKAAPTPTNVHVYETNLSPIEGSVTEAELNELTPSIGAGLGHTVHMLEMMRLGVQNQNAFALPQYEFQRSDGLLVKLWGIVRDMGTTNRRRPQFLVQSMANSVIGGNMVQTTQTGANPTWNQPLSSDSVQLNGAHYLQSFAFQNGSSTSTVIFNLNQTSALPVTFSGTNAPSGSVQMTQITSANITDNNETSQVVQPTTQTLSGFNPATGLSLPPFSMTVLTVTGNSVQAPAFSVAAGSYTSAQTVSITDGTSGAAIHYTTDGSTPTASSNAYTGPITVSSTETLQAIATASGLSASPVTSAVYTITKAPATTAATPVFSVAGGTYSAAQTVTIADATSGAVIYYTTNGTTPTTSSTKYAGAITVSTSETLEAIAVATNYANSGVATATYTISGGTTATPTFSVAGGTYSAAQTVTIADATSGAAIYYTTNGTTPTTSSTKYTGAITVSATETLEAIGVATNHANSAVATAAYTIQTGGVATPKLSLASGTYAGPQTLTITDATAGATIYYQINNIGSAIQYTGPITVSTSETVSAAALGSNYAKSALVSATYTITGKAAAAPAFSLASGSYYGAQSVTLSSATSGASIYYTTNGATPSTSATKYTGAIKVSASETVKAVAAAANMSASAVTQAAYTIQTVVATPAFSLAGGTYSAAQAVTLTDATPGATIYYTTNGTTPTTSSTKYTGAITVGTSETVKAIATAANLNTSAMAQAAYTIQVAVAAPTFSLAAGTYTGTQKVTITDATAGTTIYYQINGVGTAVQYTGPITVSTSETISATAISKAYQKSQMVTVAYVIKAAATAPTLSVAAGTYATPVTVEIKAPTPGAVIYYTTNGQTPTTSSARYTAPVKVSSTATVKAIAVISNTSSPIATAIYVIKPAAATPTMSLVAGTYTSAQTIILKDATAGATIFFTTNGVTPTIASPRYSAPFKVSATSTVKAIAVSSTTSDSAVASATYTIKLPAAAAPTMSLIAGTYTSAQTITLKDATAGATIYFTTNGATPTTSSARYAEPLKVSVTSTVKAIAVSSITSDSAVASATYTIKLPAAEPTMSLVAGTYTSAQTITLKDATAGATIYFTTNGVTPTIASPRYAEPFKVSATSTVKAIAVSSTTSESKIASATYTIKLPAAEPTMSLVAGTYTSAQTIILKDATAGATIYFTTNGVTPTIASPRYTAPFKVSATSTVKAIAVSSTTSDSKVASATYTIKLPAAEPTLSLVSGTYTGAQTIILKDATAGATIYFTTNGVTPTIASPRYTAPFKVSATSTVKAIAVSATTSDSKVASATYTIKVAAAVATAM